MMELLIVIVILLALLGLIFFVGFVHLLLRVQALEKRGETPEAVADSDPSPIPSGERREELKQHYESLLKEEARLRALASSAHENENFGLWRWYDKQAEVERELADKAAADLLVASREDEPDAAPATINRNTCPGCGGPGEKHPEDAQYWCPNGFCTVSFFDPRGPSA